MEFRKIAIGCVLSALLAVPVSAMAAGGQQMGGSQMGGAQMGNTQKGSAQMGGAQKGSAQMGGASQGATNMERSTRMEQIHNRERVRSIIGSVQEKLNAQGYTVGKADGIWGPRTSAALRKYQQDKGLQATGRLDQETANALGLEQGEFSRFEEAIQERSRTQTQQKERIRQPGEESGGM